MRSDGCADTKMHEASGSINTLVPEEAVAQSAATFPKTASTHERAGEASVPTGNRNAPGLRRAGKGALALALERRASGCALVGPAPMPRQRTDHSRIVYVFPDDFPAAAGAVQGGVRPVVGGAGPPSGDLSLHRGPLAEPGSASPFPASDGVAGPGRRPGPPPPVHRVGRSRTERPSQASAEAETGGVEMQKGRHTGKFRRKDVPFAMQGGMDCPSAPGLSGPGACPRQSHAD